MVKSIYINDWRHPEFKALPYNTKLYLKTTDDIIREAVIIGGEFKGDKEGYGQIVYTYKIAGLEGTFVGSDEKIKDNGVCGSFYPKIECITKGANNIKLSEMYCTYDFVSVFWNYIQKAGDCKKNGQSYSFFYLGGSFDDYAYFKATKLGKNGRVYQEDTLFNLWFDKNGWHGSIPAIDNGEAYHNQKEALSHYKYTIVTFDDCGEVAEPKDEEITLSVKIKKSDVEKLKTICKIQ